MPGFHALLSMLQEGFTACCIPPLDGPYRMMDNNVEDDTISLADMALNSITCASHVIDQIASG